MDGVQEVRVMEYLERIARALERIAAAVEDDGSFERMAVALERIEEGE